MFLHFNQTGSLKLEPALFFILLNPADEGLFFHPMITAMHCHSFMYVFFFFRSFPAKPTCPFFLLSSVFCVFVYQMSAVMWGRCLACGSQLWLLFNCQVFLIQCSDRMPSQSSDKNHDSPVRLLAKGLQPKTAVNKQRVVVYSCGLYGPTTENILRVFGRCEDHTRFSSSRWRLWTHKLLFECNGPRENCKDTS